MRARQLLPMLAAVALLATIAVSATAQTPMGTAFTYQGRLTDGGSPANGQYDLKFTLYEDSGGTSQVAGPLSVEDQQVTNGLFTVKLDFGSDVFIGDARWLQVAIRPGVSTDPNGYIVLDPLQEVTAVPYALHAAGSVPVGSVIDWWRADSQTPFPNGYQVCDGSPVTDPASPLYGQTLPDLRERFVMGATDVDGIGVSGGSNTHSHSVDINHDHTEVTSTSSGSHYHAVDIPALESTTFTQPAGGHQHRWLYFNNGDYQSYQVGGAMSLMCTWNNGIGNEGEGHFPVCDAYGASRYWYTEAQASHVHTFSIYHDHDPSYTDVAAAHNHAVDLPALGTAYKASTTESNLPRYYGLLKIMRIK